MSSLHVTLSKMAQVPRGFHHSAPATLSSAGGEALHSCQHLLLNLIVPVPHAPLESRKIPVCRC